MKSRTLLFAAGAALTLSGCISFGSKPPPFLLRLTPAQERQLREISVRIAAAVREEGGWRPSVHEGR